MKEVLEKSDEEQERGYRKYLEKVIKLFPCVTKSTFKAISKYTDKVKGMIKEGTD